MEERGFKTLSVAPRSHQDQSQRVNCKPKFTPDLLRPADFMPVSDVGTAMICAAFLRPNRAPQKARAREGPFLSMLSK